MRITQILESTVPVRSPLRNARVDFSEMTATVVAVVTDCTRQGERVVGYAFSSFGRYACGGPLRERFIPRLLAANPADLVDPETGVLDPARALDVVLRNEKRAGHAERSMAVGTLELALWDIVGKLEERPLYRVLADRFNGGAAAARIPCYAGGGFYQATGAAIDTLKDEVGRYLAAGYTMVKIKAGGLPVSEDLRRIEAVTAMLGGGQQLALDASCAFERKAAIAFARAVEPFGLRWLEEPCDPLDFETYRALREAYAGTLAGGENLFAASEVENFLRYGRFGGKIVLQPDPPLAYGIGEFLRIVDVAQAHGVPRSMIMPHGGNMMSLHVAAGLGLGGAESYPGLFGEFGGFSTEVSIERGMAQLPQSPGIGFEQQPALFATMSTLTAGL